MKIYLISQALNAIAMHISKLATSAEDIIDQDLGRLSAQSEVCLLKTTKDED